MLTRELLVPQLVYKVGTDTTRMDVEVTRLVWFDGPSEKREVFENVSEGRDEVQYRLLHRVVRLGDRWEEVVDRGPDQGDDEVEGMDFDRIWARDAESGGGPHPNSSGDWLRHEDVKRRGWKRK